MHLRRAAQIVVAICHRHIAIESFESPFQKKNMGTAQGHTHILAKGALIDTMNPGQKCATLGKDVPP